MVTHRMKWIAKRFRSVLSTRVFLCLSFVLFYQLTVVTCCALNSVKSSCGRHEAWSQLAADQVLSTYPNFINCDSPSLSWNYPQGLILYAIWNVWEETHDQKYLEYIKRSLDFYLTNDGEIKTYSQSDFRLDDILMGRIILELYRLDRESKYKRAADILRGQLRLQPRTSEGGFWHKRIYPNQMWLDGLYMAEPFYAQYAEEFGEYRDFDDIARQFILVARRTRDPKTGLMYHGWDSSKKEKWADPRTGDSPCFWGRSIGWYMMGLVDVLDYFPNDHPERKELESIFKNLCASVLKYQDSTAHLWYQVVDQGGRSGNFLESSASAMFAYSFAKGAMKRYLPSVFFDAAKEAFDGIIDNFVQTDKTSHGKVDSATSIFALSNISGTVGLGGDPYRDGSYEYYTSVPRECNNFRGLGPFILAALKIENVGKGKVVGLDYYFNNEWMEDSLGTTRRFHYIWEDTENTGYSELGNILRALHADLTSVDVAPNQEILNKLSVYMIVDPDTPSENPHPKYITESCVNSIVSWVKKGGVLVLFANDSGNCEFEHLNQLSERFGIRFNQNRRNNVIGKDYNMGAFKKLPHGAIFNGVKKIFLKDICTLTISRPAKAELIDGGNIIMASSRYGKGTVFAVGDPWFYNEYLDNRKLPVGFENAKAARNLFTWLLARATMVH
jgi:unsaturated rhamnogalacturonyl hydrolase